MRLRVIAYIVFLSVGVALLGVHIRIVRASTQSNSTYGPSTLSSGLVGWWTMDGKNITSNINDSSGNGNNGTMVGATTTVTGKIGQALNFNGSTQYITVGPKAFGISTAFTVSCWIKTTTSTFGQCAAQDNSLVGLREFQFRVSTGGVVEFIRFDASATSVTDISTTKTVNDNKWHHIAAVFSNTSGSTIYIDGVAQPGGDAITTNNKDGSEIMGIGARYNNASPSEPLKGSLDDVRIYNRALSATEIKQLYNLGAGQTNISQTGPPGKSGLLSWYTFDGGASQLSSVTDSSGNGNTATPQNLATSSLTSGKTGQGISFNASKSQYILTPLTSAIGTGSYSYSVWFKTSTSQLAGLISRRDSSGAPQFSLNISNAAISGAGNVLSILDNDGTLVRSGASASSVTDGKWHFAVIVRDSSTLTTVAYLDGSLAITSNSTAIPNHLGTDNIIVGASGNGGSAASFYFTGSLDDARVYNRALSAQEVLQIYDATGGSKIQASVTGPSNGLVGWYTFDGGDTNWATGIAKDESGNSNNGQLNSMSTTTSPRIGKIGQAMFFDGVSNFMRVAAGPWSSAFPNGITMSAWVKYPSAGSYNRTITIENPGDTDWDVWMQLSAGSFLKNMECGSGGSGHYYIGTKVLQLNTWYHVVCETDYTGAGSKIYINGVADTIQSLGTTPSYVASKGPLDIGKLRSASASAFGVETVDDVRIYNRVLSFAEIQQLYAMGK